MTRPLTIFRQCFHGLVDECDVVLIDVEAEKTQFTRRRSENAVKEHERRPNCSCFYWIGTAKSFASLDCDFHTATAESGRRATSREPWPII